MICFTKRLVKTRLLNQCFGLAARIEEIKNHHKMAIKIDLRSETSEKHVTAEFINKFSKKEILVYSSKHKQNKTKNNYASKSISILMSKLSTNKQYLT